MLTVEWHPAAVLAEGAEVVGIETRPYLVDGLSADEAFQPLGVIGEGVLTVLENVDAIVQTRLELCAKGFIAFCSIGQCQCCQVVTAHVSFEAPVGEAPVGERGVLLQPTIVFAAALCVQSGLTDEGGHEAVGIIAQQQLCVAVHGSLQRTVQEGYILQVKVLWVQLALGDAKAGQHDSQQKVEIAHRDYC